MDLQFSFQYKLFSTFSTIFSLQILIGQIRISLEEKKQDGDSICPISVFWAEQKYTSIESRLSPAVLRERKKKEREVCGPLVNVHQEFTFCYSLDCPNKRKPRSTTVLLYITSMPDVIQHHYSKIPHRARADPLLLMGYLPPRNL